MAVRSLIAGASIAIKPACRAAPHRRGSLGQGCWSVPIVVLSLMMILVLGSCGSTPPSRIDRACVIFAEKPKWREAAQKAANRWESSVPILLAFIRHESAFVADAKPPRRKILWLFPGPRPSSAYGYPQALDSTWEMYRKASGRRGADRDDFADAVDFVGWYNEQSVMRNRIDRYDAYSLYLAYYSGHRGYARGDFRGNRRLQRTARNVAATADRYAEQLTRCSSGN